MTSHLCILMTLNICDSLVIKVDAFLDNSAQPILVLQFFKAYFFIFC